MSVFVSFLEFVIACWNSILEVMGNTNFGGMSYLQVFVAIGIVSIVVGLLFGRGD